MDRRQALPLSALLLASPLLAQSTSADKKDDSPAPELERMRSYIAQMQTNLTMLPAGYSAVKHQFELEIEMWRMLVAHLERADDRRSDRTHSE